MAVSLRNWEFYTTGQALVGASVSLYTASLTVPNPNSPLSTTTTDSNGMWSFSGLAEGDYDVKVTYNAKSKWYMGLVQASVSMLHGQTVDVTRPNKNRLINPTFIINQRGTIFPTADNTYGFDRWRLLAETTGTGAVLTQEVVSLSAPGGKAAAKLAVGASANTMSGLFQVLEGQDIWDLRGSAVSLQATMQVSNVRIGSVRMAVLQWTGTEDAVSADPINTGGVWPAAGTNPSLTAGWAYSVAPSGATTGVITPTTSYVTYKFENIPVSPGATNLAVLIWIDDKSTTAGDALYIQDVQLEKGLTCTAVERRHYQTELALCQRYYEKSYEPTVNPGTATPVGAILLGVGSNVTNYIAIPTFYAVPKRVVPTTLTFYDDAGTSGKITTFPSDISVNTNNVTPTLAPLASTSKLFTLAHLGGGTVGALRFQFTANAEL